MFGMQEQFDNEIEDFIDSNRMAVLGLESLIEELIGIRLTDKQRDLMASQLQFPISGLSFDFSKEQVIEAGYQSEAEIEPLLYKAIEALPDKIAYLHSNLDEVMETVIASSSDDLADEIVERLFDDFDAMLDDKTRDCENVTQYVRGVWGESLNLYQGLIAVLDESIDAFLEKYPDLYNDNPAVEVLFRIHAKSNQIAKEIYVLMANGFADGAQARWRTLHELAVVSHFISEHGNECAERYLAHDLVEEYKYAQQHNEYCDRLGQLPYSTEDISSLEADYSQLLETYGKNFRHDYGWAADALSCVKPNFRDIEKSVELDHHRPLFKSASSNVHANSTGVLWRLGVSDESSMILAGPSEMGIESPACYSMVSLVQIATALLNFSPTMDGVVASKVLHKYSETVHEAFMLASDELHDA